MRKKLIGILFCMLMVVGTLLPLSAGSCQQITLNSGSTRQKESINSTTCLGFIRGYFKSITWEGNRCVILSLGQTTHQIPLTFVTSFRSHQLGYDEQIQLINPKFCLFLQNFIVGFSKIYFPKSTVSMHVVSQNDSENTVTLVVDSIEGGSVWRYNMDAVVYTQSDQKYSGVYIFGPYRSEYLSVGDQFSVTTTTDGYYRVVINDDVTGNVLYSSPLIKF